jgi:stage IV sporulation protein FB
VPVQFHSTFLLHPVSTILWLGGSDIRGGLLWPSIVLLAILCVSMLAHEFAHILAARRCGIGTRRMVFLPVGAVALLDRIPRLKQEFWVAVAGPLASLALAGCCQLGVWGLEHWADGLTIRFLREHSWMFRVATFLRIGCYINLAFALFNLLPCFPMDGGRIFRSLLAMTIRKFRRRLRDVADVLATKIAVRCVAWPVAVNAIAITISCTHLWPHLILFPMALAAGEVEYWHLRNEEEEP